MTTETIEGRLGASIVIDACFTCQRFWFDGHESLQLAAAGVLHLFDLIGKAGAARPPANASPGCPRCRAELVETQDMQRNVKFRYLRCPASHGRLISFVEFLREKNFIRPLSPQQIEELRKTVQSVACSNCGAPIDLVRGSTCSHCGSPLSMLDMKQASAVVAELRQAANAAQTVDPMLPLKIEQARLDVERQFREFERGGSWFGSASAEGLVSASVSSFARWLKGQF